MVDAALLDAVREALADPTIRTQLGGGFTADYRDQVDTLNAQVNGILSDPNIARSRNGPLWMSGASILDGTVTADKLIVNSLESVTINTGTLDVTGTITAAASFPAVAARININSSGLIGYSDAVNTTFKLLTDGSGEIGRGANKITWDTSGVVTVPVATIGSLTIAAVGGGILGGTYQTAVTNQHINISTAGIVAYNATSEISANETFRLNATTGAMTATGSFTVKSASTGAHVTIDNSGGIAGYNATSEIAGNRTFLINAATGAGQLGISPNHIGWDASGNAHIGGVNLSSGKITASAISVTDLAAINANLGTITAGTINASSVTVSNLSFTHMQQTGTLGAGQNFGVNDLTINSTGKLKFGTSAADYISNNILHFDVTSSETAKIEFQNGSNTPKASLNGLASSSNSFASLYSSYNSSTSRSWVSVNSLSGGQEVFLHASENSSTDNASFSVGAGGGAPSIDAAINGNSVLSLVATNRAAKFYGYIYPGTGSATQTTGYIDWNTTVPAHIRVNGGLEVTSTLSLAAAMNYTIVTAGATSGALPSPTKWMQVNNAAGSIAYYVPVFTSPNPWSA